MFPHTKLICYNGAISVGRIPSSLSFTFEPQLAKSLVIGTSTYWPLGGDIPVHGLSPAPEFIVPNHFIQPVIPGTRLGDPYL